MLGLANCHVPFTGATGTGKTITLQVMAERFSSISEPLFMADVKGSLSGLAVPRGGHRKGILAAAAKSADRSISSQVGRALFLGILGSILCGRDR
ncbi:MAG: DUF853 family protein [Proteobacteria bacterium]|nr:DUF853 family protein [Pseudomonadota bacterium]